MPYLLQRFGETAAVVVEGVLASHENASRRVVGQYLAWGSHGTDEIVDAWLVGGVSEIGFETDLEEGVRQYHVVEGSEETGSEVEVVEVQGRVHQNYPIGDAQAPLYE